MFKKYKFQLISAVLVLVVTGIVVGTGIKLYRQTDAVHGNSENINEITRLTSEVLTTVQEFIVFESRDVDFYETKISLNLKTQDELILKIGKKLNQIDKSKIRNTNFNSLIEGLSSEIKNYNALSSLVVYKIREKGFKDYGTIGEMRRKIHYVEQNIDPKNMSLLLSIRRHEKDYLLCNQDKYIGLLENKLNLLNSKEESLEIKHALGSYYENFSAIIEIDKELGYNTENGIIFNLKNSNYKLHNQLNMLSKINNAVLEKELAAIESSFFKVLLFSFIAIVFLGILYAFGMVKYNTNLKKNRQLGLEL